MSESLISAYLLDDEALATKRLARLLQETEKVSIVGSSNDPVEAAAMLSLQSCDVLFLDIEMPGLNGFDVLAQLNDPPFVIFTTAYQEHALKAFQVNAVDYLLKPIEFSQLERALTKVQRMKNGAEPKPDVSVLLQEVVRSLKQPDNRYPARIASKIGDRVDFIDLNRVTHIYARDKLTYVATRDGKSHMVDYTIADLEHRLNPNQFLRIHRSTILNLDYVQQLHAWFGGRSMVRLNDERQTELTVARERVKDLREKLGL